MTVYIVGGWVRDTLLGVTPKDADFVVVGCSPQDMLDRGFEMVGKDFPVFLHPITKDEYALARVERKIGQGYNGFECEWEGVTLEQDLARRDLTINAMAQEVEVYDDGSFKVIGGLIDPFGGLLDLTNKYLRNTTDAFSEDSLRVLRVGRFLARYGDFKVTPSLESLCDKVSHLGELNSLTPERVWIETEKALKEKHPEEYFEWLINFDFDFISMFKDMMYTVEDNPYHKEANVFVHTMMVIKHAAANWDDPEVSFAALCHDFGKPTCYSERGNGHGHDVEGLPLIEEFCKKWRVPNNYKDLALIVCEQHQKIHQVMGRDKNKWSQPKTIMKIFEQSRAIQKPERFMKVLLACESDAKGRVGLSANDPYLQKAYLHECLKAVINLDTKQISSKLLENGKSGEVIGAEIRAARINEIRKVRKRWQTILLGE